MYIQVHDINSRSIENKVSVVMNYVVGMGLKHDRYFVSILIGYMRPGSCNQGFLGYMRLLITTFTRVHISSLHLEEQAGHKIMGPFTGVQMLYVDFKKCQCGMSLLLDIPPAPCQN